MDLKYYQPDPSTPLVNKFICVSLGLVFIFILAFLHGILTAVNPIIYLGIVATIGFGLVFGVTYRMISKIAKVRDKKFIVYSGIGLAIVGMYFSWGAYIGFQLGGIDNLFWTYASTFGLLTKLESVFRIIADVYETGAWEVAGISVRGIALGAIWLAEIAIVVFTAWKVLNAYHLSPFNERFNKWYTKYKLHDEYQSLANERSFLELEGSTTSEKIKSLKSGGATRYGKISIYYLENAGQGFLLYENMARDSKGKKATGTAMLDQLVIPKTEAKQIIDTYHGKKEFYFEY